MGLRADHVAGGVAIAFGLMIIALSGDLPTGHLSMPGSGFMPKILAVLIILFGVALVVRANQGPSFSEISWSDGRHAVPVILITAAGTALYTVLGFIITMMGLIFALLLVIERRALWRAAIYSIVVVLVTYIGFEYLLLTPLPHSPFSY